MKPRYLTHDFDAGKDLKILRMRLDGWGSKGVGLYWLTIEYLFSVDGKARMDELKLAAVHIGERFVTVRKFVQDCIDIYQLFQSDGEFFWSNRLLLELKNAKERTEKARGNALKRNHKNDYFYLSDSSLHTSIPKQPLSHSSASAQPQLSYGSAKEIKKKKKEEKHIFGEFRNVSLSDMEYKKCLEKHGEQLTQKAIEYLASYKASEGKSYKSDYAVLIRWGFDAVIDKKQACQRQEVASTSKKFSPRLTQSVWDDEEVKRENSL